MTGAAKHYDAIVVGARCAGAALAAQLARGDMDVLMIDRDRFPSDTLSTHVVWPNGVAELDRIGALERLRERHDVPEFGHRFRILGHEIAGGFTPIEGFDYAIAPRRTALDSVLVDTALDAGAETRLGEKVTGVLGGGSEYDPVRGIALENGDRVEARWVFGCDGRGSKVAGALGLEKRDPLRGEFALVFAYWTGLPTTEYTHLHVEADRALGWMHCEDGVHLLAFNGPAEITHGGEDERERRYLDGLGSFPETLDAAALDSAERVSELRVAPETLMRGYYRDACGPGWALVGDAGHFKHPATAQGIGDAFAQASYVADDLLAGGDLSGYAAWRDDRSDDHYAWSFEFAKMPDPELAGPIFGGISRDAEAGQDFRDTMSRITSPRQVMSKERLSRWFSGAPANA